MFSHLQRTLYMSVPIAGTLLVLCGRPNLGQVPKVVSVCDVLTEPARYSGQLLSIQAALESSLADTDFDELAPLESGRCHRSRRQDSLRIGIGAGLPSPPENFKPDIASYENADKTLQGILEKNPNIRRLVVTVEGFVYDGGPRPSGVSRHPWHPALMLISKWQEIRQP
jgi:hypothetical protein